MGYRASKQASTGYSPYFLLYQQEMRLPIDNEILPASDDVLEKSIQANDLQDTIRLLLASRANTFQTADSCFTEKAKGNLLQKAPVQNTS